MAVKYLLSFNEWMGLTPELRLNDWLSFAIVTPLMFGIAFQLPMIMLFLERLGVVDVPFYRRHRRVALFGLCLVTVVLTPSADPATFLSLMLPLWTLYEGGILLCRWWPRPKPEVTEGEAVV
jgi:sec-independent protein translocase protein TatC